MSSSDGEGANLPAAGDPAKFVETVPMSSGRVTSAILSKDEPIPDNLQGDDDDDDEDIRPRKRGGNASGRVDEEEEEAPDLDGDLFGDEADDELREEAEELNDPKPRQIDDEELDSGDDEGRDDRAASEPQADAETKEAYIDFPDVGRQPVPEPSDGEMYLLKVPNFMAIEPQMFDTASFQVPTTEHHSRKEPPSTFSAFNTAMSAIRWRHSPSQPDELQSNARILRWSDGSLTLQLASDPTQQYVIAGNALAPRQRNPLKPTPTSLKLDQQAKPGQQTYTYLTVPHESAGLLRVTHRITAGLAVLPSATTTDDALQKLQSSLAAAVQSKGSAAGGIELMKVDEDPELGRKKAEVAEKEKLRAQKRREAAETRERERGNRTLGRAGLTSQRYGAGGLTAGLLEDDEMGTTRPRAKPKARRGAYNDEYDSDEDLGRRRGNFANDDYEVDDFVAGSDEEEEVDAESEEEDVDDGIRDEPKARSPKRSRKDPVSDEDAEAAEDDDVVQAPKVKRRRAVVDEDDEDDE